MDGGLEGAAKPLIESYLLIHISAQANGGEDKCGWTSMAPFERLRQGLHLLFVLELILHFERLQ